MADEQQPDDDEFPAYDDNRRNSVELHEADEEPVPSQAPPETDTSTSSTTAKMSSSASSSPKKLGGGGGILAGFGKSGNSALFLKSVGSGAVGGPRGFPAGGIDDAADTGGKPKQRGKHRRIATDTRSGADSISNADFLKELNKDLPREEAAHMKKKSNELKYERDLKHALMKLAESEEQRNTAVEIIGNLERENDDLKQENERLHSELQGALTECQILEKSYKTLQETYTHDKREFEETTKETEMKLKELQEDIQDKDLALREAEQGLRQRDESIGVLERLTSMDNVDSSTLAMGIDTDKEKKLYEKYHNEKRKVIEKDNTIQQLLQKLETNNRSEIQVHQLQEELERTKEEAQEALMSLAQSQKAMESELIALASRNSQFQKEKEELQRLLEEAAIESNQLREHVVRGRTMTNRNLLQRNVSNMMEPAGDDLEAMGMGQSGSFLSYEEEYYEDDYEDDQQQQEQQPMQMEQQTTEVIEQPKVEVPKEPVKQVPDVVKEYLHLTASAVKIKHPKVTSIDSEQLIKQVSQFSFWEYHDHMVRIMKNEEKKIEAKQQQEEQRKKLAAMQEKQAQQQAAQQSSGILGKFRNFFGGSKSSTSNAQQRHQSVMQKSNKQGGLAAPSRVQSKSVGTTGKSAPTTPAKHPKGSKSGKSSKSSKNGHSGDKTSKHSKTEANGSAGDNSSTNKDSSSNGSVTKNKENVAPSDKDAASNSNNSTNNNNNSKRTSSKGKSKSPAPLERIENGLSKAAEKIGFSSPQHKPDDKEMEIMAQQEFKSIAPIAPSEDEADDGNAVL